MKELISPVNYLLSFFIGAVINTAQGHHIFISAIPFFVPVFVQALSKSTINFRNRNIEILLQLPKEKKDPVFVIDTHGKIIATTGKTAKHFKKNKIGLLHHIFSERDVKLILNKALRDNGNTRVHLFELYSDFTNKWYQVQVKNTSDSRAILIWLVDINSRKSLDYSLSAIRHFSTDILVDLPTFKEPADVYDRLPRLLLQEGYSGIFFGKKDSSGILGGHVYKNENDMFVKSDYIPIVKGSPVTRKDPSKASGKVVFAIKEEFENQSEFEELHLFNKSMKDFLGFFITEYVHYQDGDISIVAFNKDLGVNESDLWVLEIAVNSAKLVCEYL